MIVVTGATGKLGRLVIEGLCCGCPQPRLRPRSATRARRRIRRTRSRGPAGRLRRAGHP
jgi:hypothetical protein